MKPDVATVPASETDGRNGSIPRPSLRDWNKLPEREPPTGAAARRALPIIPANAPLGGFDEPRKLRVEFS